MKFWEFLKLTPVYDWYKQRSFSQFGEDVAVFNLLGRQKNGIYVDIGAFHPKVFSNTYLFYKLGWRGICVEPNPEVWWKFWLVRPRDVFVNCGVFLESIQLAPNSYSRVPVSGKPRMDMFRANLASKFPSTINERLNYYVFEDGAVSTFDKKVANANKKVGRKLLETIKVPVRTLADILEEHVPKKQIIDLLSVDVEGMDIMVLKSNNWKKYSPKVVVCEDLGFDLEKPKKSEVYKFLVSLGYKLSSVLGPSLIFTLKK